MTRPFKGRELRFSRGKLCKKQYAADGLLTHPNHLDKSAGIRCILLAGEKPPVTPDRLKTERAAEKNGEFFPGYVPCPERRQMRRMDLAIEIIGRNTAEKRLNRGCLLAGVDRGKATTTATRSAGCRGIRFRAASRIPYKDPR